jgi:hypothetical protein
MGRPCRRADRRHPAAAVNRGTGTLLETTELPQNRDRHESIAHDELGSSCAKAPFRGLSRFRPRRYGGDGSAVDTMGKGKGVEHGPFSFVVISQIMVLR